MITIHKTRNKNNHYQFAFISLVVDGGTCRAIMSVPIVPDLQAYCDAHEDEYILNILGAMYPDAEWQDFEGETDLAKFEDWIAKGHKNGETVIEKVPFEDFWSINIVSAERDMESSVFYKKTIQELEDYIDANWDSIATSKATFKKLVREVRNIVLRSGWEK
jgi:hypothetical protein